MIVIGLELEKEMVVAWVRVQNQNNYTGLGAWERNDYNKTKSLRSWTIRLWIWKWLQQDQKLET